jgi:murein L,D-transpeptidase YafK
MTRPILIVAPVLVLLAGTLLWANHPDQAPLPADARADRIVIDKSEHSLALLRGETVLKRYRVSFGGDPAGHKRQEGDERTPEGVYLIDRRNPRSSFHRALHISYPNADDEARARARGVSPGGDIMIHGIRNGIGWIGKLQRAVDWTNGCVSLTNWEMDEVWRAVADGTPVEIEP